MRFSYTPQGICPEEIIVTLDGDTLTEVEFIGGCDGNLKALSRLVKGMNTEQLTQLLTGIDCDERGTSCSDQLVKAVRAASQIGIRD